MFLNGGNGKHTKFGEQNGCFGVAEVNVTVIKGIMRGKYLLLRNKDADICRHQATSLVHPPKRRWSLYFLLEVMGNFWRTLSIGEAWFPKDPFACSLKNDLSVCKDRQALGGRGEADKNGRRENSYKQTNKQTTFCISRSELGEKALDSRDMRDVDGAWLGMWWDVRVKEKTGSRLTSEFLSCTTGCVVHWN